MKLKNIQVGHKKRKSVSIDIIMPDAFYINKRSENMRKIKAKNTKPEKILRKAIFKFGYRFRLHVSNLPGNPDIVLPKYKTVIQVRGCFWHSHNCIDGHLPKSRQYYWKPKLSRNKQRDILNDCKLRNIGWHVIVVWECKIMNKNKLINELKRINRILGKAICE